MSEIKVVNIKCGGCEARIKSGLNKAGLVNVEVDPSSGIVRFDGDFNKAKDTLSDMGYPIEGSSEAKSFYKKAKSYVSCMIGRTTKNRQ
jgi:copper chaperone CopZ